MCISKLWAAVSLCPQRPPTMMRFNERVEENIALCREE